MKADVTPGKLYVIPTIISENTQKEVLPPSISDVLGGLDLFFVENVRTARRFLSSLKIFPSIDPLSFELLDKDTAPASLDEMFQPLLSGRDAGLLSESGCPGIADPGALAVAYAHRSGVEVVPLVGPSSLLLALMGSGLNGQRFAFHGYLPVHDRDLVAALRELERESAKKDQTQIFIETPYRNNKMIAALLKALNPGTLVTVAVDLTGKDQQIITKPVKEWRATPREFPKLPAVFLFLAK